MKKTFFVALFFAACQATLFGQGEDPERVFKFKKKESLDDFLKERKWKAMKAEADTEDGPLWLYRKKSFGGGYNYIAVYPGKMVHSQKWEDEKHDYEKAISYEEFQLVPDGRTQWNEVLTNQQQGIKFIRFNDPSKTRNENNFYGSLTPRSLEGEEEPGLTGNDPNEDNEEE